MTTLQQLLAKKAELEQQIEQATTAGRNEALLKIKALMEESGLTVADLQGGSAPRGRKLANDQPRRGPTAGQKVAAKYRDPASGNSWSGRGLQPKWLKAALADGKKITDFAV